jgi:hypothetical protein
MDGQQKLEFGDLKTSRIRHDDELQALLLKQCRNNSLPRPTRPEVFDGLVNMALTGSLGMPAIEIPTESFEL